MGAIYKVRHRLLDEIRVIKVIRPHLSTNAEMGERFLREARLAIRVRHPNIAQLHDFSVDPNGTAYIVMEFIDGLTLADVLAGSSPIPLGLALEVAHGALGAIGYLHRRDMIHRDISPDNLMLGRDEEGMPRVTLLDLGIAKSLVGSSVLTSTGAFLGKPRYASPEHFKTEGLEGVGPRSDLYSFGVVLYELLTGVCPVQGRDLSSWIAGHLFRPPLDFGESDPEKRVPPELRAILLKVLAKAPEDRFVSAQEMIGALEPLRVRHPVEPGALERALGAPDLPQGPIVPPSSGTTQEALDRRFAPLETPLPQPAGSTLILTPREAVPAPEAPRVQQQAEHTHALSPRSSQDMAVVPVSSVPVFPGKVPGAAGPSLMRRLLPAIAGVVLLVFALGMWRVIRSREAAPVASQTAENVTSQPKPEVAAPRAPEASPKPEGTAPVSESSMAPVPVPPPSLPEPPKPQMVQPAAGERSVANSSKGKAASEAKELPAVPLRRESSGSSRSERTEVRQAEPSSAAAEIPAPAKSETTTKPEPALPQAPVSTQDAAPQFSPIQPARVLRAPALEYPREARGSGIHAVIILRVLVNAKGEPAQVEVRRSMAKRGKDGKPPTPEQALAFQNAAFIAAYKTRFAPAMRDGKPQEWLVELVQDFQPE